MRNVKAKLATIVLSIAVAATSFVPSQAMPLPQPVIKPAAVSDVQNVQFNYEHNHYRGPYYGGYRGYRDYRPGYRHHNGYWFPLAAFATGAIIGGALAQPRYVAPRRYAPRYVSSPHVSWCANRYRSYRAYDNTFQPYNGPRQQCYSPYR